MLMSPPTSDRATWSTAWQCSHRAFGIWDYAARIEVGLGRSGAPTLLAGSNNDGRDR
jgi:hypothetical protein